MLIIVGKQPRSTIAVVGHFEARVLQALRNSHGAQSGRSFLGARLKPGGAGWSADQGNLLRLTGDFDRQSLAPCIVFPSVRRRATTYCFFRSPFLHLERLDNWPLVPPIPRHSQIKCYLRGAAAMVASSGGSVKRTSSRIRSRSR